MKNILCFVFGIVTTLLVWGQDRTQNSDTLLVKNRTLRRLLATDLHLRHPAHGRQQGPHGIHHGRRGCAGADRAGEAGCGLHCLGFEPDAIRQTAGG